MLFTGGGCSSLSEIGTAGSATLKLTRASDGNWSADLVISSDEPQPESLTRAE